MLASGCASYPAAGFGELDAAVTVPDTPFVPQDRYQCGPAALQTVLLESGADASLTWLVDRVYVPGRQGSFQVEVVAAARAAGRIPYRIDGSLEAVGRELAAGRPVLVLQNLGVAWYPRWHFAVVYALDPVQGIVSLRSGTDRERHSKSGVFLRTWARADFWGIVVLRPEELPARPDRDRWFTAVADFERSGRASDASVAWTTAARRWPDEPMPWFGLGNVAYAAGAPGEAEKHYRRALAVDPAYAMARNNLAWVLADFGRVDEAIQELDAALAAPDLAPAMLEEIRDSRRQISDRGTVDTLFHCGNGLVAQAIFVGSETLRLRLPGGDRVLQRERSASGARYTAEGLLFWNKGDEALLDIDGVAHHCSRVPAESGG